MISRWMVTLIVTALATPIAFAAEPYFPAKDWETVEPEDVGWDPDKLAVAVDFAMSRKSSGVVILHRGRILAERYQEVQSPSIGYRGMVHGRDHDGHPIEDVASAQKSVVSFLVGVAQEKGLVKLDDSVHQHLGVGWSQATSAQESAITLRHLITMTSGLNERLQFVASPGKKWNYNSTAYSQSLLAVAASAGKSANELTEEWLTEPVGMQDSHWIERAWTEDREVAANRYGFATTARDLARFGLLILANGKWNDQVLLSDQTYLKASLSPSQTLNPSYGYLWWLNGQASSVRGQRKVDGPLIASAPDDLVAALGALGRKCYVVPSLQLVVTRLGDSPELVGKPKFDDEFWRRLLAASPK